MSVDLALLLLRVVFGLILFGHGSQKLFGWFGGSGLKGTQQFFGGKLRMRPARFWAFMGGLSEAGGGLLLALGLLDPIGSLGLVAAMLMAVKVHWPRFWGSKGGYEYPLSILVVALALGISGPGAYSLDNLLGIALPAPASLIVGLLAVLVGLGVALVTRIPPDERAVPNSQTGGNTAGVH